MSFKFPKQKQTQSDAIDRAAARGRRASAAAAVSENKLSVETAWAGLARWLVDGQRADAGPSVVVSRPFCCDPFFAGLPRKPLVSPPKRPRNLATSVDVWLGRLPKNATHTLLSSMTDHRHNLGRKRSPIPHPFVPEPGACRRPIIPAEAPPLHLRVCFCCELSRSGVDPNCLRPGPKVEMPPFFASPGLRAPLRATRETDHGSLSSCSEERHVPASQPASQPASPAGETSALDGRQTGRQCVSLMIPKSAAQGWSVFV